MFSKKTAVVVSLILMAFVTSGTVNSASGDKINKIINVSATIPTETFHVKPVFGQWPTDIELPYDTTTDTFVPYTVNVVATTAVGLSAQLQKEAVLAKGEDKIPLIVKLNDVTLSQISKVIVGNGDQSSTVAEEHVITLSIEATGTHTISGLYAGVVSMVLEDNL
ncbi:MAG: CS1 type fimbrial major subunit [Photobacterium frigidiphilum]|uniref:CS1 type fimbrial major subunit n=1 Tax=Photobacterium frigidiphilum TaxID=264736 RepID=UPI003001CE06